MKNDLPQLREQRHLSQEALAQAVGVSRQTIISIEKAVSTLPYRWRFGWPNCLTVPSRIFSIQDQMNNVSCHVHP
ncbi:helix-turn-helix domain-containing protein [Bifidobacterium sp. ESL0682]|nr:helix-turn-helix domain-containing protein [Bifidobacterium sp. ESL0682]WEV42611.1 helix-turn-helix domain-containing protein [Bifidobacterium sp. ESL0682]